MRGNAQDQVLSGDFFLTALEEAVEVVDEEDYFDQECQLILTELLDDFDELFNLAVQSG